MRRGINANYNYYVTEKTANMRMRNLKRENPNMPALDLLLKLTSTACGHVKAHGHDQWKSRNRCMYN